VAVLLGLAVAACFGSGDFFGGVASRRAHTLTVLGVVQLCAVVGAVIAAVVFSGSPSRGDLALGAGAGALNVIALGALYQGLAIGRMGIVAPVTAVVGACVPVAWGLANGERPSTAALVGVALAVGAGAMIAREHDTHARGTARRALVLAIGAGLLFGWSFVLYAETAHDSGFWPALAGRAAAAVLVVVAIVAAGTGLSLATVDRRLAILAGVLDVGATVLLLVAVREGLSSLVAPVAALGPAFTVAWAWAVLHEPVARLQIVGLGVAILGLALIAAG
jgi:drug/metabolite transporter (DMT)-like permease